jgi:Lon protease-like protein
VAEADARMMMTTLEQFLQEKELTADWDQLRRIQPAHLIDSLVSMLPLSETEKQALLETVQISDRLQLFTRVLQGGLHGQRSGLIN